MPDPDGLTGKFFLSFKEKPHNFAIYTKFLYIFWIKTTAN